MSKKLICLAFLVLCTITAAAATQPVVAYTFACAGNAFLRNGVCPQGGRPDALIQGSDGNFYGTAQVSGEGSSAPDGGTVFSLTPNGAIKVLHTFVPGSGKNYAGGNLPGFLMEGPDGKLYGSTLYGGNGGCNGYCGTGLLYRINRDGSGFQIVHKFCTETTCGDGVGGFAIVTGTDGNLYGTTSGGGSNGYGTIYRVTPSTGHYEVLFNFTLTTGGVDPSSFVVGPDGTFYGISSGSTNEILFHYTESTGNLETFPLNFPTFNSLPSRGGMLTLGPNGNFYGLYTIYGSTGDGMYEVAPDGSNLQLFPFYTTQDGSGDPEKLLLATDGNFYLVDYNGQSGYGDIEKLSPANGTVIQTLTPFGASMAVGAYPATLIQASDGTLWGSTGQYGKAAKGQFADGTVFNLNLGLPARSIAK